MASSIRRYVLPLLTSWRQKKSPGSIAAQWIRAICFHDSSLSDTYGHHSRFHHYVLFPPIPFSQIVHCKAKCFPLCQCHHQRVALADAEGAADLLGDDDPAEVVDPADDACSFHSWLLQCCCIFVAKLLFACKGEIYSPPPAQQNSAAFG